MGSPGDLTQSPDPGDDADVLRERDRIAAELQTDVIQRVFAIGLNMQGTAAIAIDPVVRRRVDQAIADLDRVVQIIRDTVFDLERHQMGRGLRAGIVQLCEQLSPVPDVTFRGPVDSALHPTASAELVEVLADAMAVIGRHWSPAHVDVTAGDGTHVTMLRAVPLSDDVAAGEPDHEFHRLRDRAARAGMRIDIQTGPGLVQISWHAAEAAAQARQPIP